MVAFETVECSECGERFGAVPDANAAREGYCSPACETGGKSLG